MIQIKEPPVTSREEAFNTLLRKIAARSFFGKGDGNEEIAALIENFEDAQDKLSENEQKLLREAIRAGCEDGKERREYGRELR